MQDRGGWFVIEQYSGTGSYTNRFEARIEPETGRGNVLVFEDIPQAVSTSHRISLSKAVGNAKPEGGIESLWYERDTGNDILKFEYDLHTGNLETTPSSGQSVTFVGLSKAKNSGFNFPNTDLTSLMLARYMNMLPANAIRYFQLINHQDTPIEYKYFDQLPGNTWVTIIIYIDYSTGYLYLEVPSMNKTIRSTNPVPLTPNTQGKVLEPIDHITITFARSSDGSKNPLFVKYDNLKISAVNTLPLSLKKLAATTFTIFPNPVTDIVTITNSENIGVEEIEIFDISGKKVQSQNFSKENEVQLNLGDFAAGTYLLHIKTNEGTAVEKVVKK